MNELECRCRRLLSLHETEFVYIYRDNDSSREGG